MDSPPHPPPFSFFLFEVYPEEQKFYMELPPFVTEAVRCVRKNMTE
jgi:hypothetical protein